MTPTNGGGFKVPPLCAMYVLMTQALEKLTNIIKLMFFQNAIRTSSESSCINLIKSIAVGYNFVTRTLEVNYSHV